MNTLSRILLACSLASCFALLALPAFADKIYLKDGSTREGIITADSPTDIRLRINDGGLEATISIPKDNILQIQKGAVAKPQPPKTAASQPASPSSQTAPYAPPATLPAGLSPVPPTHGFLSELGASLVNDGPDSLARLPADIQALWNTALQQEAAGKKTDELQTLRTLEQVFHASPGGLDRLNAITQHERNQSFGAWLASVDLQVMTDNARNGFFNLRDVREVEKPALIGLLKERTDPALEPLKNYFPPLDPKGREAPFRPAQLQGITIDNAIELKQQADLAHALLLAQIKLDNHMPPADRQLLGRELADVNRIVSRCTELEPAARAAQARAEREKKLADEKARAASRPH